jgi:hypothetical protein
MSPSASEILYPNTTKWMTIEATGLFHRTSGWIAISFNAETQNSPAG